MGTYAPEALSEPAPLIETYTIEMDGFEKNVWRFWGACMLLISLFLVYLGIVGLYPYYRMRNLPVEVTSASLLIDVNPLVNRLPDWPIYTLRLDLKSTDGSSRLMHVESELPYAVYPEEAFDELELWRKGTTHGVRLLRGDAAEVRLPGRLDTELQSATLACFLAVICGLFTLLFFPVMTYEADSCIRWPIFLWRGFAIAGFLTSCSLLFLPVDASGSSCCNFRVRAVYQGTKLAGTPPAIPENVQITDTAMKRLSQWEYTVIRYRLDGQTLHGGLGSQDGVHDGLRLECAAGRDCEFKIYGSDRWHIDWVTNADNLFR
jgi:hypothetical protein